MVLPRWEELDYDWQQKKVDSSDTRNATIWDDSLSSYVFYGRSHRGNPHRNPSDCYTVANCWPPSRTVARTVIGPDLRHWGCANTSMPVCNTRNMQTIFTAPRI